MPKRYFGSTIGITGAAFCHRCGIGSLNGDLVFGDVNSGSIRAIGLNNKRNDFATAPHIIKTAPSGVHSVEVSPNRHLFFSTANGIYRLVAA